MPILLLTRARDASRKFNEQVRQRFGQVYEPLISPVLRIEYLPFSGSLTGIDGLVFTSINGVAAFAESYPNCRMPAWCVGQTTAELAEIIGFEVRMAANNLVGLAEILRHTDSTARLLYLRGRHVVGKLDAMIGPEGPEIVESIVYEQHAEPMSEGAKSSLHGERTVLVPVFSPRTAKILEPELIAATAPIGLAAMSPAVRACLPVQVRWGIVTAARPNAEGMLDALDELFRRVMFA